MMRISLFLIVMLSFVGCGQPDDRQLESSLHYITFGPGVSGLIAKVKKRKIMACLSGHSSADRDLWVRNIESVILQWVEPLRHLSADQLATSVEVIDGRGNCDTDIVIAPNTHSNTSISSYPTVRMSPSGYFAGINVLLHEFGHAFALSDTYQNGASGNCKPGQPQAVMCNTSFSTLQSDDIKGVAEIFKRTFPRDEPNDGGEIGPNVPFNVQFALGLGVESGHDKFEIFTGVSGAESTKLLAVSYCLASCEQDDSWNKMKFVQAKTGSYLFSAGSLAIQHKMTIQIKSTNGTKTKKSTFEFNAL